MSDQENIENEIDQVINELSALGVTRYPVEDRAGMGDVIESV
jgi:hypothetical protein